MISTRRKSVNWGKTRCCVWNTLRIIDSFLRVWIKNHGGFKVIKHVVCDCVYSKIWSERVLFLSELMSRWETVSLGNPLRGAKLSRRPVLPMVPTLCHCVPIRWRSHPGLSPSAQGRKTERAICDLPRHWASSGPLSRLKESKLNLA